MAAVAAVAAAGGALQGKLEAAQAECTKLQAKLTELEAQKGGSGGSGGGLGGLNLAEMEMGALRGELEGWRLVALDAQERQQRLEVDLKASQIEIKALQATLADATSRPTSSEATGAAASAPQSGLSRTACSRNPATP